MSAWTNGTYTKRGLSLLAKLTQGDSLRITRVVAGTGYVTPTALANQTSVSGIKQELSLKTASYPEEGVCKLPMFLTNKGLNTGYKARQIGVYANDPDEGEILYFISQSDTGTDVPSEATMPEYSATWTFYFRYGQASSVSINVDPSHTVTEDMLQEVREVAETGISKPNKGAVLAIKNTANLPFVNLRLFGKTTQNGTPTQENPVSFVSAGDSGAVSGHIHGKNLLNVSLQSGTHSGLTVTVHDDGKIEAKGTSTGGGIYLQRNLILAPGKYTFSIGNTMSLEEGNGIWVYGDGASLFLKRDVSGTLTVKKTTSFDVYLFPTKGSEWNVSIYPQIEYGDTATKYEKGKDPQTFYALFSLITPTGLRGITVASGGNYTDEDGQSWICDEINFADGLHIKRVETLLLSASLGWTKGADDQQTANTTLFYGYPTGKQPGARNVICDRFETKNVLTSSNDFPGIFGGEKNQLIYIRVNGVMSLEEFKAWLEANPTNIIYELKEPTSSALPQNTINAFDSLYSNNPCTTIINEDGANMEADCFLAQHEAGLKRLVTYLYKNLLAQ